MSHDADLAGRRLPEPIHLTVLREWSLVILGALVWIGVTGMTSACFVWLMRLRSPLLLQQELLGFSAGFALSGAVGGSVSIAIYGRGRRACGIFSAILTLLAIALALTRWGIARSMGLSGLRLSQVWNRVLNGLGFGLVVGCAAGFVASGIVAAFAVLTRRTITWRTGLVVDLVLVLLGFWLLPEAIPRLASWAWDYVRLHYSWGYESAILGACTGAGLGSLIGPVVLTLVASAFDRSPRSA